MLLPALSYGNVYSYYLACQCDSETLIQKNFSSKMAYKLLRFILARGFICILLLQGCGFLIFASDSSMGSTFKRKSSCRTASLEATHRRGKGYKLSYSHHQN